MKAIFFILLIAVVFVAMEASAEHLVGDESMNLVSNHGMIETLERKKEFRLNMIMTIDNEEDKNDQKNCNSDFHVECFSSNFVANNKM
ncbi:CLUMA_CG004470, isoform A [Clunio marinus]|uniref:CLUMA_CG004470, isoform A n=1 Tax=Clunio marinus TaxID=568069 RepID=A0A1J1HT90_9DIPT|nr:CLUMA_CG004470, isoform A [Clunio marinus]